MIIPDNTKKINYKKKIFNDLAYGVYQTGIGLVVTHRKQDFS